MIIGNGDLATALREGGVDRDDVIFFASGVSNSLETDESQYRREFCMLDDRADDGRRIVYFGSLCIFYSDTRYAKHKRAMEWCASKFYRHTILRLGNITWGDNPHTLINYLRAHPDAPIRDEWRYIVDKDEFLHWVRLIPAWSCEMNIPGRRLTVRQIYNEFVLEKKRADGNL